MSTGSRERLSSLPLASADADDPLRPMLLTRRGCVLVSKFSLDRKPTKGNNWSEIAERYLRREIKYPSPVFSNPSRCAYCGSKGPHLEGCGNPMLWVNHAVTD